MHYIVYNNVDKMVGNNEVEDQGQGQVMTFWCPWANEIMGPPLNDRATL